MEELLDGLRVTYLREGHHHCRPGWLQLDCPLCGQDSLRFHLGYNISSRYFHCWKCGPHRADKILRLLGASSSQVYQFSRDPKSPYQTKQKAVERSELKEPSGRGPLQPAHRRYLRERGFDPEELVRLWHIEGIGIAARLAWRIYIPITANNVRVSWTTRSIGESNPQRYISASAEQEAQNHKTLVYGQEMCRQSIVIVEGPTDAWAVGPGAGALFGLAFLAAQVRKLVQYPYRYVCFDNTQDAQARAKQLCLDLSLFPGVTENVLLDAKDPGSASKKELRLLRKVCGLV